MEKRVVRDAKFILTVATSQGEELARFDVTSIGGDIIRLMAEKGEGNGFVCGARIFLASRKRMNSLASPSKGEE